MGEKSLVQSGEFQLPSTVSARAVRRRLLKWWRANGRTLPWRQASDPYRVLIAELLLQQTRFSKVQAVYEELLHIAPTPGDLAAISSHHLVQMIRPLGLVKRAAVLSELGAVLTEQYGGRIPNTEKELLALPGVGSYIARAILCYGYGKPEPLVDKLTARFYQRLLGIPATERPARDLVLWHAVKTIQPARPRDFHLAVVDFTSLVCRISSPRCYECPLADQCIYALSKH